MNLKKDLYCLTAPDLGITERLAGLSEHTATLFQETLRLSKQDFPAVECPGFLATYSHLVEVWGRWNLCFESPRVSGKSGCALLVSL